jgi:hypothetical protein
MNGQKYNFQAFVYSMAIFAPLLKLPEYLELFNRRRGLYPVTQKPQDSNLRYEEERVISLLCVYYTRNSVYGSGLLTDFIALYVNFLSKFRNSKV